MMTPSRDTAEGPQEWNVQLTAPILLIYLKNLTQKLVENPNEVKKKKKKSLAYFCVLHYTPMGRQNIILKMFPQSGNQLP